ncbi:MAG: hypothetical protein HZC19_01140 [Candidatus Omnitrophica bacterium]|nr:hypothetical protein [Candidatus Omnitrophota bacterium]
MKSKFLVLSIIAFNLFSFTLVYATPSTTYWTPDTSDIQPYRVVHITYDNYVTHDSSFPADYGLTVGVLPFEKLQMEVGYDMLMPTNKDKWLQDGSYFNAKIGSPEGALFENSPAWNIGIFNVGFTEDKTDYDIMDVIIGKTLPWNLGRVHLGGYYGLTATLQKTATGGDGDRGGFMIAYDKGFFPVKDDKGEFNRFVLAADYATGKNAIGGGGVGLYVYFTRDISLLTGPVWFNDSDLNGDLKWTLQLDVNFKF